MCKYYFILITTILLLSCGFVKPTDSHDVEPWDLLIFTQRWPITVCREWKHQNESHKCLMPLKQDSWLVHGIWPTKFGTKGPAFCNKTWHFDPEEIRPIERTLNEFWTGVEVEGSSYSFWAHEWTKHGTCAAPVVEQLNTELKYFTQGLKWLNLYSMDDILSSVSINPSNDKQYSILDINRAIKQSLGVDPVIECRQEGGKNELFELRICFDKTLKLANCDGVVEKLGLGRTLIDGESVLTNCHAAGGIVYPRDVVPQEPPMKLYVQLYKFFTWLQWFTL